MTEPPLAENREGAPAPHQRATIDAIVLAGGTGSRLGGADKARIELAGQTLLDRMIAALRAAGAVDIAVVGEPDVISRPHRSAVRILQESPRFAGPASAIAAAVPGGRSEWIVIVACDLVRPESLVARLRAEIELQSTAEAAPAGILFHDEENKTQWLSSAFRRDAVAAALNHLLSTGQSLAGAPVRLLLGAISAHHLRDTDGLVTDIDTFDDLAREGAVLGALAADDIRGAPERKRT